MHSFLQEKSTSSFRRLPSWLRQDLPDMEKVNKIKTLLKKSHLNTVCESAHCPNTGKCWQYGVATFMILGDVCTRECRFCAVKTGKALDVDLQEPRNIALAVKALNLRYVVVTSVTRDDLEDNGAQQFVRTVYWIRKISPDTKVELLVPDFSGKRTCLQEVIKAKPEVIGHNMETVREFFSTVRSRADYDKSLCLLKTVKQLDPAIFVKSGFMVGLGEKDAMVISLMEDLYSADCDILTIGQYLALSNGTRHLPVHEFIPPEKFEEYRQIAYRIGFRHVMSGPLVRSSYIAEHGYQHCMVVSKVT